MIQFDQTYHKKVETIKIIQILAIDKIPRISRIFQLIKKENKDEAQLIIITTFVNIISLQQS